MNTDDEEIMKTVREKFMTMLEEQSGPIVRELARSKAATDQNFHHPDAKTRFAALSVADMIWGVTQEIADMCEELAVMDSDAKVRGAAVMCLKGYYRKTNLPRIVKLLATIVLNEKESVDVRDLAYSGLFFLREPDPLKWPLHHVFKFPDDVDWAFVGECLQSERTEEEKGEGNDEKGGADVSHGQ
jgi:hypothetical protein